MKVSFVTIIVSGATAYFIGTFIKPTLFWINLSIGFLFLICVTIEYGKYTQIVPRPPKTRLSQLVLFNFVSIFVGSFFPIFPMLLLFLAVGYLVFLVATAMVVCGLDAPIDDTKNVGFKTTNDGYYLSYLTFLMAAAPLGITFPLRIFSQQSTTVQSLYLQKFAVFLVVLAKPIALGATDHKRFSILMLGIYFTIDILQNILYLLSDIISFDFLKVILIQEGFSIIKNSGLSEMVGYLLGVRNKNPVLGPQDDQHGAPERRS